MRSWLFTFFVSSRLRVVIANKIDRECRPSWVTTCELYTSCFSSYYIVLITPMTISFLPTNRTPPCAFPFSWSQRDIDEDDKRFSFTLFPYHRGPVRTSVVSGVQVGDDKVPIVFGRVGGHGHIFGDEGSGESSSTTVSGLFRARA
jgi:hypothetical protein